MEAPAKPEKKL
jgi:hypothetical protein